jgi:hypothetical protein
MAYEHLDDAYDRLRSTGPEFDGYLSNHGPMAVEALVRHGYADGVSAWLDGYTRQLEPAPGLTGRLDDWHEALGQSRMLGAWLDWFDEELRDQPWGEVLATWWPRLLPGIAAGATHGVIRVGHAVRVLRDDGETPARIGELAQGLGYWAARWQQVPGVVAPRGHLSPDAALAAVPTVARQNGGIGSRLAQLEHTDGWGEAQAAVRPGHDAEAFLRGVVTAAVHRYATHGHGNAVMLVHAATAPNAVLRTLPSLPRGQWAASAAAAWTASAAVQAAYSPASGRPAPPTRLDPVDIFDQAVRNGDEHVIKLADTAVDVFEWHGDQRALAAIDVAATLIQDD